MSLGFFHCINNKIHFSESVKNSVSIKTTPCFIDAFFSELRKWPTERHIWRIVLFRTRLTPVWTVARIQPSMKLYKIDWTTLHLTISSKSNHIDWSSFRYSKNNKSDTFCRLDEWAITFKCSVQLVAVMFVCLFLFDVYCYQSSSGHTYLRCRRVNLSLINPI